MLSRYHSEDEIPMVLSAKEVSKVLGISPSSAYGIMHDKTFPTFCIGKRLLVKKSDLFEWIAKISNRS